ncbi:uncharacterized protein TM35_000581080 [Trypanosoma theileri]|uniref:Mucin-associated surface protein (MASP) n=1 Tax=Trypanosoma theileri TaxID=67003 RepID=A0A1X0NGB2_9TRYP|nr:uncharacterized protein TM35_000581080 [Trypanosoma theileri]ORC83745.1 hypothetical protein TM35_000581080 [Trypanosoma theileri]
MKKVVMVRCYMFCLLTLALCCACGLVWSDSPKVYDALIKTSTVGVPSLVRRAVPAFIMCDGEDKDDDECHCEKEEEVMQEPKNEKDGSLRDSTSELGSSSGHSSHAAEGPDGGLGSKQQESKTPEQLKERTQVDQPEKQIHEKQETPGKVDISTPSHTSGINGQGNPRHLEASPPAQSGKGSVGRDGNTEETPTVSEEPSPENKHAAQQRTPSGGQPHDGTNTHVTQNEETPITRVSGTTDGEQISANAPQNSPETSSTNSATPNANESADTQSESTSTQEGNVESADTDTTSTITTTTTTLPPELTNNKKGDADSSSSISSSVWVRVPLLIVVTLSCILVC